MGAILLPGDNVFRNADSVNPARGAMTGGTTLPMVMSCVKSFPEISRNLRIRSKCKPGHRRPPRRRRSQL